MTRNITTLILLASLAVAGTSSAAAEEVNYNGGTLTQEWKSTKILENATYGRFAYGVGNKFYIHNNFAGKIQVYNQNGATEEEYSTGKARIVPAMAHDDAGNWVIRTRTQQNSINTSSPEFRIISADGTQKIDITLPSSIVNVTNGNSFLYLGAIAGNLFSNEGAKLMFTGAQEDGIYVMQIRNGALVESESFKATMNTASLPATMPIKYTTESYVTAWKAADGTTHYLYVTRSDNPIDMQLDGHTLNCTAIDVETQIVDAPVHRGQSNGFWMFAMGGKNYMALPCLPNWLDGFMVVEVNDDGSMTMKGYHKNDYPKLDNDQLYPNENMSSNWLNTEPIDDHSCYIYQYFPWGYTARYKFTDDTDETTLDEIVNDGTVGETYTIADDIVGVYVAAMEPAKVYAKDLGKHRYPSVKESGWIDYVKDLCGLQTNDWDQSNWVLLEFTDAETAQKFAGRKNAEFASTAGKLIKGGTITGTLTDKLNPTMTVTAYTEPDEAREYVENKYVTNNFMNPLLQTSEAGNSYFFVEPKPQEYAYVHWATYDGADSFHFSVPTQGNEANLKGGFKVKWDLYPGDYLIDFEPGKAYNIHAIVRHTKAHEHAPRRAATDVAEGDYEVYPLEGGAGVITGVQRVDASATVQDVTYFNLMGMQSATPFEGVNIILTRYTDGTYTYIKQIK